MFCNRYIIWPKQFKLLEVPADMGSIVVVDELTCCALLHSTDHLKATQMNVLCSLIQDHINSNKAILPQKHPKIICCVKGQGVSDPPLQ